jgi:hypothetical protein
LSATYRPHSRQRARAQRKSPAVPAAGDGIEQAIVIAPGVLRQSDIFRMRFNLT